MARCLASAARWLSADTQCWRVQLSNLDTLRSYLLGSGSERKLPVQRAFRNEVVGSSAEELMKLTGDFGGWLQSNCTRQLDAYRCGTFCCTQGA